MFSDQRAISINPNRETILSKFPNNFLRPLCNKGSPPDKETDFSFIFLIDLIIFLASANETVA